MTPKMKSLDKYDIGGRITVEATAKDSKRIEKFRTGELKLDKVPGISGAFHGVIEVAGKEIPLIAVIKERDDKGHAGEKVMFLYDRKNTKKEVLRLYPQTKSFSGGHDAQRVTSTFLRGVITAREVAGGVLEEREQVMANLVSGFAFMKLPKKSPQEIASALALSALGPS